MVTVSPDILTSSHYYLDQNGDNGAGAAWAYQVI